MQLNISYLKAYPQTTFGDRLLEGEKSRIDAELAELRGQLGGKKSASTAKATAASSAKAKTGGKFVRTAAQKAKTADAMKKLWAKVRRAGFTNIKDYQASLKKA